LLCEKVSIEIFRIRQAFFVKKFNFCSAIAPFPPHRHFSASARPSSHAGNAHTRRAKSSGQAENAILS
jgi:hypothetical protein